MISRLHIGAGIPTRIKGGGGLGPGPEDILVYFLTSNIKTYLLVNQGIIPADTTAAGTGYVFTLKL